MTAAASLPIRSYNSLIADRSIAFLEAPEIRFRLKITESADARKECPRCTEVYGPDGTQLVRHDHQAEEQEIVINKSLGWIEARVADLVEARRPDYQLPLGSGIYEGVAVVDVPTIYLRRIQQKSSIAVPVRAAAEAEIARRGLPAKEHP